MKVLISILALSFGLAAYSQEVVDVSMSSCDKSTLTEYIKNRLISKEKIGDTTILQIGLIQNCGIIPEFHLKLSNDTLFVSVKNTSDIWEACDCCYEFEIKAIGIQDTNFITAYTYLTYQRSDEGLKEVQEKVILDIQKNKYIFPTLNEINDNSKTNQWNSDSLKIGIWNTYFDSTEILKKKSFYYVDSNGQQKLKWSVNYNKEGQILDIWTSFIMDGKLFGTYLKRDDYLKMMENEP